ncbi:hypothetical protein Lalb_Chr24g0400111 [Lupinus albus]|uniref:Uncharacterized protein n=1 Tax=Lupinus albus TaxID=3870 RepID=A0A6A4NI45_LUPAL|nr:hypothetical protein Lalb_Chr24g0400111 [Lupinus albus]
MNLRKGDEGIGTIRHFTFNLVSILCFLYLINGIAYLILFFYFPNCVTIIHK